MFSFALDNPSLGTTLVLISSSYTLAYTISVLGARRYRVTLVSTPGPDNSVLLAQAFEVIDWACLLSQSIAHYPLPAPSPPAPAMQNSSDGSSPERPPGIECNPHPGSVDFLQNIAETLEVQEFLSGEMLRAELISSILSP